VTQQGPYLVSKAFDFLWLLPTLARLPRRLSYPLARARGRWYASQRPDVVDRIARNADEALGLGEARARGLARQVFENHSLEELESYLIPRLRARDLPGLVTFQGLEHLDAARAPGHGVILLVSHFGSLALSIALLGLRGYPIQGIAGPYGPPHTDRVDTFHLDQKVKGIERCTGVGFVFVGHSTGIEYRRILRAQRLAMLAVDAALGDSERLPVAFLGRTARLPYSFLRLARLTRAPVVSYWTLRQADGIRNTIRVEPPLAPPAAAAQDDFRDALQRAVDQHARYIREYPDHWCHICTPASWATVDALWEARQAGDAGASPS
jgi:KDO2-lipid IV(A) lauroyltransferase